MARRAVQVIARSALIALGCLYSVNGWAAPDRMGQPHVVGVYGSVISIEHAPRQSLRDIRQSPLKVIHEAGLVLLAIKGDMVADASDEMRGEVFQLLPFGGFPRLHKFVDLLGIYIDELRNAFRLSGEQRVRKHFIDRHVAFPSDDLTEFAVFVARRECCEIQHIFQKNVGIDSDLCCRGIAGICQVEDQMEWGISIGIENQASIVPHVNSNPCPLTGNQSSFGEINGRLHVASLRDRGAPSGDPETYGRSSEHSREGNKPEGEIRRWIAAGLFPEPVILALLGGALVGCFIVAAVAGYGIKERQRDKQPKRKEK
jgi:hypothetical protein